MTVVDLLQKLDISPTAAKVYLALLELGKASVDKIAKRAGTYKANTYDALEKLADIGLATHLFEGNKKFFIPTSPEKMPQIIADREEKRKTVFDELKKEMNVVLPQLLAKYNSVKEKELFEIYRGRKAYKAIMNEIVKEKPRFWKGFGNLQVQEFFPIEFQRWFKNITITLFSTEEQVVKDRLKEARKTCKTEISWLPQEVYMPIVWVIFGNNVLIIIYEPDILLMRIKSEQITKTFSNQFNYLWKKYAVN